MQISTGFVLAAMAATASAHATVWGVWVNGAFQGDGRNTYIRSPPNNNPVTSVTSSDINCNANNRQVASQVSLRAGDSYTVEWYHNNRGDDIIDLSHKGPHTFYIARASSNGSGGVWTKICEQGLSGGRWAVENIVSNGGKISCTIPSWVAAGDYLIRAEILALHEGTRVGGAQFYPSCAQVKVTSGGSTAPGQNFNFQTGYSANHPGILFNLYNGATSYQIPGPSVWSPGSGGGSNPPPQSTYVPPPTQTTPPPSGGGSGSVAKYGQCGGIGYSGPTGCQSSTCTVINPYYSQCL
jgi:cellulase